jgi:hypothetical protein
MVIEVIKSYLAAGEVAEPNFGSQVSPDTTS